jgi:hypothetical protein
VFETDEMHAKRIDQKRKREMELMNGGYGYGVKDREHQFSGMSKTCVKDRERRRGKEEESGRRRERLGERGT